MEKEVTRIDKKGEKITKHISYSYNLLMAKDSWQALYQIFSIILLKEFMKLKVNTDTMIKNVKLTELI